MKVNSFKKVALQNLEHSQFAINLHTICTEANIEKVNALLPALKTCIDKEEQALNLPRGKEFITEIRQLDAARDESYRALQFTVRAAKHRRAADVQAAADEVEKVMRRYPELAAQSNNKETSGIRNLADDLNSAKYKPLVTKIGAKADLDQLVTDNEAFAAMFLKHYSATPPSKEFDLKKLRAATDEAVNAVVLRMQSLADLLPDTVGLADLITRYNKMVADSHLTLALRKAANKKKPGTGDGEKPKDKKGKKGKNEKPDTGGIGQEPSEKGILIDGVRKTVVKATIMKYVDDKYFLALQFDAAGKEMLCVYFVAEGNKRVNDMTRESDVYWVVSYDKDGSCVFFTTNVGKDQKCKAGTLLYDIDIESGRYRVDVTTAQVGKSNGKTGDGNAHTFAVRIDGTAEVKK